MNATRRCKYQGKIAEVEAHGAVPVQLPFQRQAGDVSRGSHARVRPTGERQALLG